MKKYKLAIFDLDGTLLDTLQDLANSTNFALRSIGFPTRSIAEIRNFVGNGVKKLIERAVPTDTNEEDIEKTLAVFKSHYAEHCEDETKPYDGIMPLLDSLRENGIMIAVVSNKIDSAVSVLCRKYFGKRIAISAGDREDRRKKPAPDAILEITNALKIPKEYAVYIGDSEVDIETAKNAEMDCISVTWGFRDMKKLISSWGLEEPFNTQHSSEEGVFYGKGTAYFADSAHELQKILLCVKK